MCKFLEWYEISKLLSQFIIFHILFIWLTGNPGSNILFPVHVQSNVLFMWPISNKCMIPHTNIDFVCDLESRRAGLRWRKTRRRRRRLSWLTDSLSRLLVHFLSVCCLHVRQWQVSINWSASVYLTVCKCLNVLF